MRSIRKGLIFLLVDVVIIIGIFVIQFRTDSSIIEKFGKLQLSLESAETSENSNSSNAEENITVLNNKLQVTYNGLNFHSDDQNCAKIAFKNEEREIKITDWEKTSDLSFRLHFTEDTYLTFILSDKEDNAALYITAELPQNAQALYIPFNYSYSLNLLSQENGRYVLSDKKSSWDLVLPEYNDGFIRFTKNSSVAHYAIHDTTHKFTFNDLADVALADEEKFNYVISDFKNNLISSVKASLSDANLSEQAVVSYIAAMAENGKYQQALDDIPQSFKRGNQRSYLSSPYLNNLVNMNNALDRAVKDKENLITKTSYTDSPDIFTERNLASHLIIYKDTVNAKKILEHAANYVIDNLTIAQISGIIRTYCDLLSLNTEYAALLKTCIPSCIEKITEACTFENNILVISENGSFLSVIQAVETGAAVLRYGLIFDDETLIKAGRVIIGSYLAESSVFDYRTLSNIYPILAYDNWYYPHIEIIHKQGTNTIWAWTCAKSIKYKKNNANSTEFLIDFTEGASHYVIFKGVQKFDTIYLYNMAFRTDPRFETYNSSGYVYQRDTETLLLKSRHKNSLESVRMEIEHYPTTNKTPVQTTSKETTETKKENKVEPVETEKTETKAEQPIEQPVEKPTTEPDSSSASGSQLTQKETATTETTPDTAPNTQQNQSTQQNQNTQTTQASQKNQPEQQSQTTTQNPVTQQSQSYQKWGPNQMQTNSQKQNKKNQKN
ncbi:MAG: hypothetical protein K6A43_04215 [Treponema sp.]|nr:hypothetical protein [Treponema sp.]